MVRVHVGGGWLIPLGQPQRAHRCYDVAGFQVSAEYICDRCLQVDVERVQQCCMPSDVVPCLAVRYRWNPLSVLVS